MSTFGSFEVDQQMKDEYLAYGQSTLDDIERALLSLSTEETSSKLEDIRRQIHSLKGTGTSYGFPDVTRICGLLEDSIKQQRSGLLEFLKEGMKDLRDVLKKPT